MGPRFFFFFFYYTIESIATTKDATTDSSPPPLSLFITLVVFRRENESAARKTTISRRFIALLRKAWFPNDRADFSRPRSCPRRLPRKNDRRVSTARPITRPSQTNSFKVSISRAYILFPLSNSLDDSSSSSSYFLVVRLRTPSYETNRSFHLTL